MRRPVFSTTVNKKRKPVKTIEEKIAEKKRQLDNWSLIRVETRMLSYA